jgi:hypothetical protein
VSRSGPRRASVCRTDSVEKLNRRTEGSRMKIVVKSSIAVVRSSSSGVGSGTAEPYQFSM